MNTITIELCAEDRARLDRLTAALEARASAPTTEAPAKTQPKATPTEAPSKPTEQPEAPAPQVTPTQTEEPKKEEPAAPWEETTAAPSVTLEQIQQKVMQLATMAGGTKKPKAREIINAYGSKVSDLKEHPDKWDEVWEKLTALEQE